jgi:hypothetical protein
MADILMEEYFRHCLRNMFGVLGLNECATTPENGDTSDPRNGNLAGEHNELRRSTNKCWDGLSQPPSATGKDIYFPNLQKMLATFIVPSDVKLKYRATGERRAGGSARQELERMEP